MMDFDLAADGLTGEDPPPGWRPTSGAYRIPGASAAA